MNENENGNQGRNSSGIPYNDQSKQSDNRRGTSRAHDNKKHISAAQIESTSYDEDYKPREYHAEDLNEAVIWVRELDPNDTITKPLISAGSPTEKQENRSNDKLENMTKNSTESVRRTNSSNDMQTTYESASADDQQVGHDTPELTAINESTQSMERTYFWNQPDVQQEFDRDVLPYIGSVEMTEENTPTLDDAVNPNVGNSYTRQRYSSSPSEKKKSGKSQKSGFITRRREKRTVKSQSMEGDSFERTVPAVPFSEFAPATEDAYVEPVQLPVESIEQIPQAGTAEDYIDSPIEYNESQKHYSRAESQKNQSHERRTNTAHAEITPVQHELERTEQLEIARSISIDGVSVYEMFVARRIDESGLRKIIVEYLRGGDLRDVIKNEIIRQQLKFERDPQLRDRPVGESGGSTRKVASGIRQKAMSVATAGKSHDTSEKFAELAHLAIEKSQTYFEGKPKSGQMVGIVAIVVIYVTILIVALAK